MIGPGAWVALSALLVLPPAPSFPSVRDHFRPSDVQVLDRHGEVLHEVRVDPTRRRLRWAELPTISPALVGAVVAAEDRRFFRHRGVDLRALARAAIARVAGSRPRGASTISMQLAALLDPRLGRTGGARTLGQKWRQIQRALAIEGRWPKAAILEAYLNIVTFRGELQGVAAASAVLFSKAPHGLSEAEASVLAVLIRAPNASAADTTRRSFAVQRRLRPGGDHSEIAAAVARALGTPSGSRPGRALAPHLAARVTSRRLIDTLGLRLPSPPDRIETTIDGPLQRVAAASLERQLLAIRAQNVHDGAVLVVDNLTGEVLAYVGGSGSLSDAPYVDAIPARRQPGSTLKPFLYGLAFDARILTAASLLDDSPLDLAVARGLYRPRNYDSAFRGFVTTRLALASSLNVPAVRTLELLGTERFVTHLRRLGFAGLIESGDFYGPALALGSADVSLWELVNAYRALATGGVWSPLGLTPDHLLRPAWHRLPAVTERPRRAQRVFTPEAAFVVAHILADREGRSATFGLENPLATPFWTAVKTGTSKDMRDNWCIGFSRHYTVGVWVGNVSGAPMHQVSGVSGAAPVWLDVMTWLHRREASPAPPRPGRLTERNVRFPGDLEPPRRELFLTGTEPAVPDTALAPAHPRILAPAPGTVVAIDPDIPGDHQRLVFEARSGGSLRWVLDDLDLGPASRRVLWGPTRGRHTLRLVDDRQSTVDTVAFEVR